MHRFFFFNISNSSRPLRSTCLVNVYLKITAWENCFKASFTTCISHFSTFPEHRPFAKCKGVSSGSSSLAGVFLTPDCFTAPLAGCEKRCMHRIPAGLIHPAKSPPQLGLFKEKTPPDLVSLADTLQHSHPGAQRKARTQNPTPPPPPAQSAHTGALRSSVRGPGRARPSQLQAGPADLARRAPVPQEGWRQSGAGGPTRGHGGLAATPGLGVPVGGSGRACNPAALSPLLRRRSGFLPRRSDRRPRSAASPGRPGRRPSSRLQNTGPSAAAAAAAAMETRRFRFRRARTLLTPARADSGCAREPGAPAAGPSGPLFPAKWAQVCCEPEPGGGRAEGGPQHPLTGPRYRTGVESSGGITCPGPGDRVQADLRGRVRPSIG